MKRGKRIRRRIEALFFAACLCVCGLTGCGDGITEETEKTVTDKTGQALTLYADIEKLVADNNLTADQSFTDMKKQLTDMSAQVKAGVSNTTEDDGQKTVKELDRIINNLQTVKASVEKSVADSRSSTAGERQKK